MLQVKTPLTNMWGHVHICIPYSVSIIEAAKLCHYPRLLFINISMSMSNSMQFFGARLYTHAKSS